MRGFQKAAVAVVRLAGLAAAVVLLTPTPSHAQGATPPTVVRPGDRQAQQPFQKSWGIPFNANDDGEIAVPAGKRLVLEYASLDASVASDCRVGYLSVSTIAGGTVAGHYVPISSHVEFGTRNVDAVGQLVKFYADPETTVYINYGVAGLNCNPIGSLAVSGYFVDAP